MITKIRYKICDKSGKPIRTVCIKTQEQINAVVKFAGDPRKMDIGEGGKYIPEVGILILGYEHNDQPDPEAQ